MDVKKISVNIRNKKYNNKVKVKLKLSKNPSYLRKKLIFGNNATNDDIDINNSYGYEYKYNTNKDLIKNKKEFEEKIERERKIMEWFFINDISISKRDLYETFTTLIQTIFRGWKFRKKFKNLFYNNKDYHKQNNDIKKGIIHLKKIYFELMKKNI